MLATSRASLLVSGRKTRSSSTIWSRLSTSRVSALTASNSASFLRSSASSRLTWNDSERRGDQPRQVGAVESSRAAAEVGVPLGLVDDQPRPSTVT